MLSYVLWTLPIDAVCLLAVFFQMRRIGKPIETYRWSIQVHRADAPLASSARLSIRRDPSLRPEDVTDVYAETVADPFLLVDDNLTYLFFEVYNVVTEKGEIGLARSRDGEDWTYDRIALAEPFHLSYPQVFKSGSAYYMIPESVADHRVLLYRARNFPYDWEVEKVLLEGDYVDSSLFQYGGRWWMFSGSHQGTHLFLADSLDGEWKEHPQSPILRDTMNNARPAGRVLVHEGRIYRYAQHGEPYYGHSAYRFRITELTEQSYREEAGELVLEGGAAPWNRAGMHHLDQQQLDSGEWLIAADGHSIRVTPYLKWRIRRLRLRLYVRWGGRPSRRRAIRPRSGGMGSRAGK
ncbi:hypothetical protein F4V43_17475 [Paenibacillus spiritus]|uniref:Glucosamine inositolphosphorylceramide transferase 1 N-terminal domain-containing protein n=1 Tax=Paenibacillus spiritus TaxID=2496557 RepID=A0A5J5FUW7_9BACL|nr:hypothetical protein [Paenibacillus spiritus]KAA8997552.1 hypothetical protein F4V43_17475 [Paenibacillus spiritus]